MRQRSGMKVMIRYEGGGNDLLGLFSKSGLGRPMTGHDRRKAEA